jgi:hypothetical protein
MAGVLCGVDHIIDKCLQVLAHGKASPHYRTWSSYYELSEGRRREMNWHGLVRDICDQIKDNYDKSSYHRYPPSNYNWALLRRKDAAEKNKSPEVILERQILRISPNWYAQLATSSGLCGPDNNKRAAIDLIFDEGNGSYQLIELKAGSDHPLKAAMEVLIYGALYLFSRSHASMLGYKTEMPPILKAKEVHLRVLGPVAFYDRFGLEWLADGINVGLRDYLGGKGFTADFQFDVFPDDFDARPPFDDKTVAKAVTGRRPYTKQALNGVERCRG